MKKMFFVVCASMMLSNLHAQETYQTLFETSNGTETPVYQDVIGYFEKLAADFQEVKIVKMGMTDSGLPLHVVLFDRQMIFDPEQWHQENRLILFINNGIHPGEPDGIDASMLFLRDVLLGKTAVPQDLAIAIVPIYNIGGHLNRGAYSRVNQNGPIEFGFRGNARNFDLNRDFIKADTKNAKSFQQIFHWLKPQVFIDTHVSNGADYQHIMTLIATQHNRLGGSLGNYLEKELNSALFRGMKTRDFPMVPYVNAWTGKPEDGWNQFKDSGRYSSGYAALFNTLSFMPETHMLKSYSERVSSTYSLLETFMEIFQTDGQKIVKMAKEDRNAQRAKETFGLNHQIDKSQHKLIEYLGYESGQKPSEISGLPRLFYDRTKPFTKEVKFYDTYAETVLINKPSAYLIPQGWYSVIETLQRNGVKMKALQQDSVAIVTVYEIKDFQTGTRPYEGHYLHSNVQIEKSSEKMNFRKGDWLVPMDQEINRYIIEVLEPEGEDSFFAWNFFDTILQSKEGYSAYVFEDLAADFLKNNPELKKELEVEKSNNEEFAKSASAQLRWVYDHSPWKEKEHNRYPVYRVED
jgi:hypothetical protein